MDQTVVPRRRTVRSVVPTTTVGGAIVLVVLCGWAVSVLAGRDATLDDHIVVVARDLASGLFLVAGILRLVRWRLTGEPYAARAALSLFAMGTALAGSEVLTPLLHPGPDAITTSPDVRAAFLAPAMLLLAAAPQPTETVARPPVSRRLAAAALTASGSVVVLGRLLASAVHPTAAYIAIEVAAGAGWAALALRAARQSRRLDRPVLVLVAGALGLMALSEAARVLSLGGVAQAAGLGSLCQLAAAAVVALAASIELRAAMRASGDDTLGLARALLDAQTRLAQIEQDQRARLHDARSAVVGVIGASRLLSLDPADAAGPAGPADPSDPIYGTATLHRMMLAELHRLQGVLEADAVEPTTDFPLADALRPVLLAHRIDGLHIDDLLGHPTVSGRPRATATAVDNLLRNVARHAPGAAVSLRADRVGDRVRVLVDDDGPGIPFAERDRVLLPGVRGRDAGPEGSGLGLFIAANTMRSQDGTLEVTARPGGGTRVVLTLPAASATGSAGAGHRLGAGSVPLAG